MGARERSQTMLSERLREENERLRFLRESRRERMEGGQTIIQEDNRTIYQVNNQYFIQHNDIERFRYGGGDYRTYSSPRGTTISAFAGLGGFRFEVESELVWEAAAPGAHRT